MKFNIGDEVKIVKDKFDVMKEALGKVGTIIWAGDKARDKKGFVIRYQPEYHVQTDVGTFIVLEEEIE